MAEYIFPFWCIYQKLDSRFLLAEAVGFAEITRLGEKREQLGEQLRRNVRKIVEESSVPGLQRRHIAAAPTVGTVEVLLDPLPGSIVWREPLPLSFPILRWQHGDHAALAYVPALGIEVIAASEEELEKRLPVEIRLALTRDESAKSLQRLIEHQRGVLLHAERLNVPVRLHGPKQRAINAAREREEKPSVLKEVTTDLTQAGADPTHGQDRLVEQLAELLTSRRPRSVLLVGPSGVGKTAAVRELVRRRVTLNLGSTSIFTTSGARLVAGMTGYGMWQDRCLKVIREISKRRAILHLGNLVELAEVGKYTGNNTGIAAFLRPYLARGELLAIAECTPEQIPVIEREDPLLLDVFQRLNVLEPDAKLGREILEHFAVQAPRPLFKPLDMETLGTIDRLHRRYATYSSYPGRPLRFLNNLLQDHRDAAAIGPAQVYASFGRETGLPLVLLDPARPLSIDETRRWFSERVLGQPEAVNLIVDLLTTTKAALTRPGRPIASLLFIGPTGVGKTELAKALAEFLFGSRQRLTRFDMSEFADALSVQRLAGGVFGSEGVLTAKVREQPFSVLLFDEFEKADPLFLDLLLQILGDGRLTDAAGRLADFCNTVVILTSNLGAESFRQGQFGFDSRLGALPGPDSSEPPAGTAAEVTSNSVNPRARDHFVREVQAYVRPELFNRIDRLVPFAPLDAGTIHQIARRHVHRLELRDGIRYRGVSLTIGEGVAAHLARRGFDDRYGARPLLRAVERELLAPLADQLNRYSADLPLAAAAHVNDSSLEITVKPRPLSGGRTAGAGQAGTPFAEATGRCVDLRRQVQALQSSFCVRELHNERVRLEREQAFLEKAQRRHAAWMARLAHAPKEVQEKARAATPRVRAADQERIAILAKLRLLEDRLDKLNQGICRLEDDVLNALYTGADADFSVAEVMSALAPIEHAWNELLLILYCRQFPSPDAITLGLFGEDRAILIELVQAYLDVAARWPELRVQVTAYCLPAQNQNGKEAPPATPTAQSQQPERPDASEKAPEQFWRENHLLTAASGRYPEKHILTRETVENPAKWLAQPPGSVIGIGLRIRGLAAAPRFGPEAGLHLFSQHKQAQPAKCLIDISDVTLTSYLPPAGITRRGAIGTQPRRRTYNRVQEVIEDVQLEARMPWRNEGLSEMLFDAMEKLLQRRMRGLLEE